MLRIGTPQDDPRVGAAVSWLTRSFSVKENPGFPQATRITFGQGIYFYYFNSLTDALTLYSGDSAPDDWANAIALRLLNLQAADGAWQGKVGTMGEDDPALATSFALLTLARCRKRLAQED